MLAARSSLSNKIGGRNLARPAAAGVSFGRGALAGWKSGAIGRPGERDRLELGEISPIEQNQALSRGSAGGVASCGVASCGLSLVFQGLAQLRRQIASFPTGPAPAAIETGQGAQLGLRGRGRAPQGGARRALTPCSPRRRSAGKAASSAALTSLLAQPRLKNREKRSAAIGVGGFRPYRDAISRGLKRPFSRSGACPVIQKSGRGGSSPLCLRWRKGLKLWEGGIGVN